MNNLDLNPNFLKITLITLITIFPLTIIFRSVAININTLIISFIVLFFICNKKNFFLLKNNLIIYTAIFFLFIFLNTIFSFENLELLIKSLGNFRYLLLSLGVFFALSNMSIINKNFFIYLNLTIIVLIGFDIFYQYIFNQNIFGFPPGMCEKNYINCTRFSGIFGSELIAGAFISQIGLLNLFLINDLELKNKKLYNLIILIFGLFLFLTILLTGERNALLIFIITLFFFFLFNKKIITFLIINFFLFILLILIAQNSHSIKSRYINLLDGWNSSKELTIKKKIINSPWSYHYQAAFELFSQKPILGHGPKSFRIKCKDTKIEKKIIEQKEYYLDYRSCSTHPHSYMMEFLSEHGIVGFLFFFFFFIKILLTMFGLRHHTINKNLYLTIGIGSLLLAIIFPFKPSGSFFSTFNASILFYIFGFFLYYLKRT